MPVAMTGRRCRATVPQTACPKARRVRFRASSTDMPSHDARRNASPLSSTMKLK